MFTYTGHTIKTIKINKKYLAYPGPPPPFFFRVRFWLTWEAIRRDSWEGVAASRVLDFTVLRAADNVAVTAGA